jgi:sigma-B regulation protein RsbU (phosphoserine phosphatase)
MYLVIIHDVTESEQQKIELQRKQALIERDLESAAAIQQSLLPEKSPLIENMKVAWKFEPCGRIGGDIFNIHNMDERNVGLYMLDVCGHGVPAALISVAVSQFLNSGEGLLGNNCELLSPEIVLNRLDHAFPFERFDSFFSIICMTLDVREGWLNYSCAGHPAPVILRAGGRMDILSQRGPVIGSGNSMVYSQETVRLHAGDRVIMYTDGLSEIRNAGDEWFGRRKLHEVLARYRREPLQSMVESVYDQVKEFRQDSAPDDDMSLLAVEYTGNGPLS